MSKYEAASTAAANWWADHVFGGTPGRSGGEGITDILAMVAGVQGTPQPNNEKREAFVRALAKRITETLERYETFENYRGDDSSFSLGVDYGPDQILSQAARDASLERVNFPWKTNMWVYSTRVVASLGYGAQAALVWQDPEWERPQCLQGQYEEKAPYDRLPFKCSALRYHEGGHVFDIPDPLCTAQVLGYDNESMMKCLHSEDDMWHQTDEDGHRSRMHHQFTTS